MIQPLRKRHRIIFLVLTVFLPVIFISGILVRKPIPAVTHLPVSLGEPEALPRVVFEKAGFWNGWNITVRLRPGVGTGKMVLELDPKTDLLQPDVLVYWSPQLPSENTIPDTAVLLGVLADGHVRHFVLPPQSLETDGFGVLFSLAHQKILATATLPTKSAVK